MSQFSNYFQNGQTQTVHILTSQSNPWFSQSDQTINGSESFRKIFILKEFLAEKDQQCVNNRAMEFLKKIFDFHKKSFFDSYIDALSGTPDHDIVTADMTFLVKLLNNFTYNTQFKK